MKPVYQTRFGKRESEDTKGGNCFQAALASLLELPLKRVPDFCNIYPLEGREWYDRYIEWLRRRGLSVITLRIGDRFTLKDESLRDCYLLTGGPNADGVRHMTIYRNGECVHNPNKRCKGITPDCIDIIFPLNPLINGARELECPTCREKIEIDEEGMVS